MKKEIKKYGNTFVVSFTKEDMRIHDLYLGDTVDVNKSYSPQSMEESQIPKGEESGDATTSSAPSNTPEVIEEVKNISDKQWNEMNKLNKEVKE